MPKLPVPFENLIRLKWGSILYTPFGMASFFGMFFRALLVMVNGPRRLAAENIALWHQGSGRQLRQGLQTEIKGNGR